MALKLNINDLEIKKSERGKKPNYQTVIALNKKIAELEAELAEKKDVARKAVKKDRTRSFRKIRYRIAGTNNDLRNKAVDIFYSRVRRDLDRKTAYVDVISGYPILSKFVEKCDLEHNLLCVLIIVYHFRWICRKELEFYGYSYGMASKYLSLLVRRGYLSTENKEFAKHMNYVCMPKGERLVEEFHDYYKKQTKKMFEEFAKKHEYHSIKPKLIKRSKKKGDENGDQ